MNLLSSIPVESQRPFRVVLQVMTQTLKHGGAGCITATANLFSKQLRQLHDSFGPFDRCYPSPLAVVARFLTAAVASSTAASDKDGALEKKVLALCQTGTISRTVHIWCRVLLKVGRRRSACSAQPDADSCHEGAARAQPQGCVD
jgi:hypothetical protein